MIKNIQIYNNHLFLIKLNSKYFKKILKIYCLKMCNFYFFIIKLKFINKIN